MSWKETLGVSLAVAGTFAVYAAMVAWLTLLPSLGLLWLLGWLR